MRPPLNAILILAVCGAIFAGIFARRPDAPAPPAPDTGFAVKAALHPVEAEVFEALEQALRGQPVRLLAQVSMGEIVEAEDRKAFWSFNCKRIDVLVTDRAFRPLVAVELQGSRHFNDAETKARDAEKQAALAGAGIALVEVTARQGAEGWVRAVRAALEDAT